MGPNSPATIWDLPPGARLRAQAFLDEGDYYGWHLKAVAAKPVGDMLECTLDFDRTTIVFLAKGDSRSTPAPQEPAAHLH